MLLNKPTHEREVYAEKSIALSCFWRCMSDRDTANELIERLYDTVFDKEVFDCFRDSIDEAEASGKILADLSDGEVIDVAVACFAVYNMSRDNGGQRFSGEKFPSTDAYLQKIGRLNEVADRFESVDVIHADAFDLIGNDKYNSSDVMIYIDPPYLPEVVPGKYYRHNINRAGHIRLLERIRVMESKIVLSGYDDTTWLYNRYLLDGEGLSDSDSCFRQWQRFELENYSTVTRKSNKNRLEILWSNF